MKSFFFSIAFLIVNAFPLLASNGDTSSIRSYQWFCNLLERSSSERLVVLIDSLLNETELSPEIILLVNDAVYKRSLDREKNSFEGINLYPGSKFYSNWKTSSLFVFAERIPADTAFTLNLISDDHDLFTIPISGKITSRFGWRDSAHHNGVDINLKRGDKIYAAFDGMVRVASRHNGYGNVVVVRHYNGLETLYAHLSKLKVKPGDIVFSGQLIGLGGSTGRSSGPHLHFETRFKGVPVNPEYFVDLDSAKLHASNVVVKASRGGLTAFPAEVEFHHVKKGETLAGIARRYAISVTRLREMNGLTKRSRVKVGETLRVKSFTGRY